MNRKEDRLQSLAFGFSEMLNKIPGIKIIPDVTAGDDLTIEHYEKNPEATIYISNPKLNRGGSYFAYANLSLDSENNLYVNLESEMDENNFTINGNPSEVIKELKATMAELQEAGKKAKPASGGLEYKAALVLETEYGRYSMQVENEKGVTITKLRGDKYSFDIVDDTKRTVTAIERCAPAPDDTILVVFELPLHAQLKIATYYLRMSKTGARKFGKLKDGESMRFALVKRREDLK